MGKNNETDYHDGEMDSPKFELWVCDKCHNYNIMLSCSCKAQTVCDNQFNHWYRESSAPVYHPERIPKYTKDKKQIHIAMKYLLSNFNEKYIVLVHGTTTAVARTMRHCDGQ